MMARIYGLRPSPAVVYNAIPWTWLIDWFSNLGDIIDNLDAGVADRLAADYLYVMRETTYRRERNVRGALYSSFDLKQYQYNLTSTAIMSVKTRIKGSPFGFGVNPNSLTDHQIAILGALGLSHL
jgi:hypothetical protein